MNKNFNYDDTLIEPTNNYNDTTGDTTRIDAGTTPPPYTPEAATEEYASEEQPQQSERKDSNSNKGIIAASAGIALIGGAAAAYGLGAFDSESEDDPNAIADAVADDAIELSEDVAEVASIEVVTEVGSTTVTTTISTSNPTVTVDTSIGCDDNVKSLGSNISVPGSLEEISLTTTVTDDMSFSTAFATARRAVGPHGVFEWRGGVYGTYYENEWKCMPADYKREFSNHNWRAEMSDMEPGETIINNVIINNVDDNHGASHSTAGHTTTGGSEISGIEYTVDDVLISTAPNDKMDFPTAYSVARADVGPGGVFSWRGGTYNTFTQEEWRNLSDASKSTFTHYDWSDEIAKAESQGNGWVKLYVDPETGEPLAEIPTDPVTGKPIDEINPYDPKVAHENNPTNHLVNDNPENLNGGDKHFVNDNPENFDRQGGNYAQVNKNNNEFVNDNPENLDGQQGGHYAQINKNNNEFVNDNPENLDGQGGHYAQVTDINNEFVNDNPEIFDGEEEYYAQVTDDNNDFVNDNPENFDGGEEYYAQVTDDNNDFVNDNPENFDGEEYIATAYEDVEVLNGDVDYYVAESADYGYGSPAVIEDDYSVAEVSSYDDSYDYNDNPEPSYEPDYDSNYDMPADDYSDNSVDIDGVC